MQSDTVHRPRAPGVLCVCVCRHPAVKLLSTLTPPVLSAGVSIGNLVHSFLSPAAGNAILRAHVRHLRLSGRHGFLDFLPGLSCLNVPLLPFSFFLNRRTHPHVEVTAACRALRRLMQIALAKHALRDALLLIWYRGNSKM